MRAGVVRHPGETRLLFVPAVIIRPVRIVVVEVGNDLRAVLGGDGGEERKDKAQDQKGLNGADAVRRPRLRPPERELPEESLDPA
jgi:hypothetical protein